MKKILLLTVILLGICTIFSASYAQDRKNVIKLGLLSPFARTLNLAYEYCPNDDIGLQLRGYYTGVSVDNTKLRGYGIIPEFRYYLSEKRVAPSGIFVAPYVRYTNFSVTANNIGDADYAKGTLTTYGGGLLIGFQALMKNIITLEAYIGPSYTAATAKATAGSASNIEVNQLNGFLVRGGVTIGVAF